jgi:hypothetical protein
VGAAWPASSCAGAHRRGPLPAVRALHPPRRVLPRLRIVGPSLRELAEAIVLAPGALGARRKVTGDRAGTPRIVRVGSSSLNGASHPRCARTCLRRAVDPGDLGRPCGPEGEGQAVGQALPARGEPPGVGHYRRSHHPPVDQARLRCWLIRPCSQEWPVAPARDPMTPVRDLAGRRSGQPTVPVQTSLIAAVVMPTVDALGTYGPDGGALWPLSCQPARLWVAMGLPAGL